MPETMLAVVKPEAAPGADVRQMPVPQIGPDDVLVKVKVASVCGTDLHIYNWDQWAQNRIKPPLIPGHEGAGVVVLHKGEVLADGAAAQLIGQMRAPSMRVAFETLVQEREAA